MPDKDTDAEEFATGTDAVLALLAFLAGIYGIVTYAWHLLAPASWRWLDWSDVASNLFVATVAMFFLYYRTHQIGVKINNARSRQDY